MERLIAASRTLAGFDHRERRSRRDHTLRRWWRRLFTGPAGLIGADPRRRAFDGTLAHLIRVRDSGRCRDPFCDAPIRHLDHIHPHRAGGPTSRANGRGVCARGNYVREMPGWHTELVHDGLGTQPHTSRAGPAP